MTVVRGPWATPKVRQTIGEGTGRWWQRDEAGALWVAIPYGSVVKAPVPMADLTAPTGDRPPTPARITMALDRWGMDGPEVDEALGVADAFDTVVDSWEAGQVVPTVDDVRRLATLAAMLPHWFYKPELPLMEVGFMCGKDGCRPLGYVEPDGPCPHCGRPAQAT